MRQVVKFKAPITPHIEFMSSRRELVESLSELVPALDAPKSWESIIKPFPVDNQLIILLFGICRPENVTSFFEGEGGLFPAFNKEYKVQIPTTVVIYLELLGTGTSKYLAAFMNQLLVFKNAGADISLQWFYNEGDEDLKDVGTEYRAILGTTNFPELIKIPVVQKQENISI